MSAAMFPEIPVRLWLLLVIAIFAWPPSQYVYRHIVASPAGRDVTQPKDDLSWRTSSYLLRSLAMLAVLFAFAIFIFTPSAEHVARSPQFPAVLCAGIGGFSLFTVLRGIQTGRVKPTIRGDFGPFERDTQPKRFWTSVSWNALLGVGLLWAAFAIRRDAKAEAREDACFEAEPSSAQAEACDALIPIYDTAIAKEPNAAYLHYNRWLAHELRGDREAAITGYGEAIRLNPDDYDAYFNRGLLMLNARDYEWAILDMTKAHQLKPGSAWPLANRGLAHAWIKNAGQAAADFTSARAIDPDNYVVARGEAVLAMQAGDPLRAVDLLGRLLARRPDDHWARWQRAELYQKLGQKQKAQADLVELRRRYALHPDKN